MGLRLWIACVCFVALTVRGAENDASLRLAPHIDVLLKIVRGQTKAFTVSATTQLPEKDERIQLTFGAESERSFFVTLDGPRDIKGTLLVTPQQIVLDLPARNVSFQSDGELTDEYHRLRPRLIFDALLRLHPAVEKLWPLVEESDGRAVAVAFNPLLNASNAAAESFPEAHRPRNENGSAWEYLSLRPRGADTDFKIALQNGKGLSYRLFFETENDGKPASAYVLNAHYRDGCKLPELAAGRKIVKVARNELERSLTRGLLRAIDLKVDDFHSSEPGDEVIDIPGARMQIKDGQRTAWLTGTPRDMGIQHGQLLKRDVRRVTDSTLYVVGMFYSVAKGEWFLDTIRDAWKRLEPHTDPEFIEELKGLAEGSGIAYDEIKLANVFPELFHCSGFALSGEATVGGKLLHGRVLDYMTEVGFQHAQCDFITRKAGKKGTVNIGYAGFVGCVSGMSDAQISMGEMGGRGEGNWDGTPMAFLMRRVLENAATLDEARKIMTDAKRTCEYYYVIADGKSRTALGVAAWPEKIEFIQQNEAHPQLPDKYPGCVLLSVGDRYKALSERVKGSFSKLDEKSALELMSRPVAMKGNLHNVLFVPEEQLYWVAHASHAGHEPAADQDYVKHDFKARLEVLKTLGK